MTAATGLFFRIRDNVNSLYRVFAVSSIHDRCHRQSDWLLVRQGL